MGDEPPVGKLFSQVYIDRGPPARDSERLRTQICGALMRINNLDLDAIASMIHVQLGIEVYNWRDYFRDVPVQDFLDTITLIWRAMQSKGMPRPATYWRDFVRDAFRERNVGYQVDDRCGVHPLVDTEFDRNRTAAIAALQPARYRAALERFDAAHEALEAAPPDGKRAIEDTFEATEIVFKLLCDSPKVSRLAAHAVDQNLKPIVQSLYAGNGPALQAADLFLSAFMHWVNAAHNYRHGPKAESPMPPPLDLAIAMMSAGASFLRWLAEIDQQLATARKPAAAEAMSEAGR